MTFKNHQEIEVRCHYCKELFTATVFEEIENHPILGKLIATRLQPWSYRNEYHECFMKEEGERHIKAMKELGDLDSI